MIEEPVEQRRAIIVSASSDIGAALARRWLARGWSLAGTYRTPGPVVAELAAAGMRLVPCDLASVTSTRAACQRLRECAAGWDVLVLCPGRLDPVGPFEQCDFDEWEESARVNGTGPLRLIHGLLPARRRGAGPGPCVLLFAGGGTNDAPVYYSAYTLSKIALVKACELLDAEVADTRFVILGTGWVKTKIHAATLRAGERAGPNYRRTLDRLAGNACTPLERVLECIDWVVRAPRRLVGGRNFSVAHDRWGTSELDEQLMAQPDMYKLRRSGNAWLPQGAEGRADRRAS
jgi:NAD(P)-dependent dehydrogenase (short-subunit alcohol dehydrogenase family)